jgi:hypothetical protein
MPKWKQRILEVTIAAALAILAIQVITYFRAIAREEVPVSAWFSVAEVFVPDHRAGTDPVIIYDRTVFENVRGFWIVEVQRREYGDLSFTECTGYGINDYEVSDTIPENRVSLSWFVGKECNLTPGTYRLRVSYSFRKQGWPVKDLVVLSNTFVVS